MALTGTAVPSISTRLPGIVWAMIKPPSIAEPVITSAPLILAVWFCWAELEVIGESILARKSRQRYVNDLGFIIRQGYHRMAFNTRRNILFSHEGGVFLFDWLAIDLSPVDGPIVPAGDLL